MENYSNGMIRLLDSIFSMKSEACIRDKKSRINHLKKLNRTIHVRKGAVV